MKFYSVILLFVIVLFSANCVSSDQSHDRCPIAECINGGNDDLSSAIICNNCTAKILSDNEAALLLREAQRKAQYKMEQKTQHISHNAPRTRFTDLNVDVLFCVFDQMDNITSMMHLVDVLPVLYSIARDSFQRKYKEYTVHVANDTQPNLFCDDASKLVYVPMKEAPKLLRMFGNGIRTLSVKHPPTIVSQYINKYTRNSLIKIDMIAIENDTFEHLTNSFSAVQLLSLRDKVKGAHLPLNHIFPNIRRLEINSNFVIRKNDLNVLFCDFPHLTEVKMDLFYKSGDEEIVNEFYLKNPQIKNLEVIFLTPNLCDLLNNHLTNVDNLTILTHDFKIEHEVTLQHVTHFRIIRAHLDFEPRSLQLIMPQLKSLRIGYAKLFSDVWVEFARKHKHLKRLEIHGVYFQSWRSEQLNQVINEFPNLKEITLIHENYANYPLKQEFIKKVIESHEWLRKLNLIAFYFNENELNQIRQYFEDWTIVTEYQNRIRAFELKRVNLWFEKKH